MTLTASRFPFASGLAAILAGLTSLAGCAGETARSAGPRVPSKLPSGMLHIAPELERVRAIPTSQEPPPRVIPQPKRLVFGKGGFRFGDGCPWAITENARKSPAERALGRLLRDELGLKPGQAGDLSPSGPWVLLRVGGGSRTSLVPSPDRPLPEWAKNPEGYRLEVDAEGAEIVAPTTRGIFYGVQTLAQLLRPARQAFHCPAVTVEDWPTLPFRGAHWFPSASGVPFHRKLIQRVMARYKLNYAVIQCEAARWESHPEIAAPDSIRKSDLRGLVDLCRENCIEPVPLVNCPGHGEWMFRNGQNHEFAEDPKIPYACCVNHPRSDAFIKDVLGEAVEVFRPRYFHLGHDEVTLRGRFPHPDCPRCRGRTVTDLVLGHARRLNDWLGKRNVRMMVWGDMLLAKGEVPDGAHAPGRAEARARRARLPRGILVADWHYGTGDRYPSLDLFHQKGLDTVACTWHEPLNIYRFAQAAIKSGVQAFRRSGVQGSRLLTPQHLNTPTPKAGCLGLLQTTWAGYFPNERVLEGEQFRQFAAFVLAAEYAWSGRGDPPDGLPYHAGTEFSRVYLREADSGKPMTLVDLSGAARVPRAVPLPPGESPDLRALPTGRRRLGGVVFRVPVHGVVVLGAGSGPEGTARGLTVEFHQEGPSPRASRTGVQAAGLALLNAALRTVPHGTRAARMTVEYTDGSRSTLDLVVGRATASRTRDTPVLRAPVAWRQRLPTGTSIALRVTRWKNPHPSREIARVRFDPVDPQAGWVLAGLTILE
jgi:hexosaminidase